MKLTVACGARSLSASRSAATVYHNHRGIQDCGHTFTTWEHVRMLKKIDCVMIRVGDLEAASRFYTEVFGLRLRWHEATAVGLGFPDTDTEIVLHRNAGIPSRVEVHYLVDDVVQAIEHFQQNGCRILVEPFDIPIGQCAVIRDPFGTTLCILDMSKGPRQAEASAQEGRRG
jgi:predicted enzyme related to lactoylglutathione lyase